nr:LysR family transcriptional regulator [Tianweitania sediminis]
MSLQGRATNAARGGLCVNWDDIRIFLAVARAGQILGAARRLGVNHATVSRRVAALEADLKTRLFRRVTTGTLLTPAGEQFLQVAERMEADLIATRAELSGEEEAVSGPVRIGAPDGFGVAFLASRLGVLISRHPQLEIQLVPVPRSFSLSRREADLAITVDRPVEGRLIAGKLVDYSLGLYAGSGYASEHGVPQTVEDLLQHQLVGYVGDLTVSPSLDYAPDLTPDWTSRFAISSALGQVEAVRSNAGIGILHTFIARQYAADLVAVPGFAAIRRSYWLVYHESVRGVRRVQTVAAFIQEAVERERAIFS